MKSSTRRMLRIASKCRNKRDFIAVFGKLCDRDSIFVATKTPKLGGTLVRFSITLADSTEMLAGRGVVDASWTTNDNPFGRPGMKIRFAELSESSREFLSELVGSSGEPPPLPALPTLSSRPASRPPTPRPSGPPALRSRPRQRAASPIDLAFAKPKAQPKSKSTLMFAPPMLKPAAPSSVDVPLPVLRTAAPPVLEVPPPILGAVEAAQTVSAPMSFDDEHEEIETAIRDPQALGESDEQHSEVTRTKGADYVLPANPFAELPEHSLEAFIECTIYEENGVDSDDEEASDEVTAMLASLGLEVGSSSHAGEDELSLSSSVVNAAAVEEREPTAVGAVAAASMPVPELLDVGLASHLGPSTWKKSAALAGGTAFLGIVLGYVFFGGGTGSDDSAALAAAESPAAVEESAAAAPAIEAEPEPAPAPVDEASCPSGCEAPEQEAVTDDMPAALPAAAAETEAIALEPALETVAIADSALCSAVLKSRPSGATVRAEDGTRIGLTPAVTELPCGATKVTYEHPRYLNVVRDLELSQSEPSELEVRLNRPTHRLRVTSSPRGATVKVGGRVVGKTPLTTKILGFERTSIRLSRAGHYGWATTVYSKRSGTSVSAKLKSVKKKTKKRRTRPTKKKGIKRTVKKRR